MTTRNVPKHVLTAEIRQIDETDTTVTALVNSGSIDRHRTIFLPSVWEKAIPEYMAGNPLLLWGHKWGGEPEDALGIAVDGRATEEGPVFKFRYATEANPKAALVWALVKAGVIRAFSVGCYILASVTRRSQKEDLLALPDFAREALEEGSAEEVFTSVELVEVSQVLLGSNRDAILKAVRALELYSDEEDEGMKTATASATDLQGIVRAVKSSTRAMQHLGEGIQHMTAHLAANGVDPDAEDEEEQDDEEQEQDEQEETKGLRAAVPATRLPVQIIDMANRLHTAGDCLRASSWCDDSDEEKEETLRGVLAILAAVGQGVVDMLGAVQGAEAQEEEEEQEAPSTVPSTDEYKQENSAAGEPSDDKAFQEAFRLLADIDPAGALMLLGKGAR